ncbi:glycogen debranching protein GlgX [Cryptosporangium sp. NPDC048952]|uniref:glycogen debranching protein GlgX n=1 Tax=Cryptosporangium sp. NPDC048952 TaxID=3363961 RepID=UPI003714EAA7
MNVDTDGPWPGHPFPLGATWDGDGVNFSLWSPHAVGVDLCLFDEAGNERRLLLEESTYHVWHGYVPGVGPGQRYGFRVYGPWNPFAGHRFNPAKLLMDPYARAYSGQVDYDQSLYGHVGDASRGGPDPRDSAPHTLRSVVLARTIGLSHTRPRVPWEDTVIYELHVRGFTMRHPEVPQHLRGTYSGLAHPAVIDHLLKLGVTSVELLPVHHMVTEPTIAARGLPNYWGYNTLGYFAPDSRFSSRGDAGGQVEEFRDMVAALHAAGIEVILDVVYNHTAEGGGDGPTLSFRGIDNRGYYRLAQEDGSRYVDYTGCGNTLDARQPAMLQMLMDSLRYWALDMGVDGFRFDLASALARSMHDVDQLSSFMSVIHQDPVINQLKLIAEPWDIGAGGYQVGNFPPLWTEWNGRYRDAVRDLWRGAGGLGELGYRLSGSSDLYQDDGRRPFASINFITAHDGFTMRDLFTYNHKHNEANKEQNRDGTDDNRSWNCGVEGETDDGAVVALRNRQIRNALATLVLSAGVPMLTAGDELRRTQGGNNNAYCQDNEISWMDWKLDPEAESLLGFTSRLLELRAKAPVFRQRSFFVGTPNDVENPVSDLAWFRPDGGLMGPDDWNRHDARTLGMFLNGDQIRNRTMRGERIVDDSYLLWIHAAYGDLEVRLPGRPWAERYQVVFDTARPDLPDGGETLDGGASRPLSAWSTVLLRAV